MVDIEKLFSEFLERNCPQDQILKNSYHNTQFSFDNLYLEFTPQFEKVHHEYYQAQPESVSFDMTNTLERIYGDLLFGLNLQSRYDEFMKSLKSLSDRISRKYIDEWEDVNFEGDNEAHYLYSIPIWKPIEAFLTDEMKTKAQEALNTYSKTNQFKM